MVGSRRSTGGCKANGKSPKVDTPREDRLLGGQAVWLWEWVLKHTSDTRFLREFSGLLPFPEDSPRLKQMAVINLLSHYTAKDLSIEKILNVLELILGFVVEEPEDVVLSERFKPSSFLDENPSPDVWRSLYQPIVELKAELRKLLAEVNADAEYVMVIRDKLTALIENAWTLLGPLFLERTEAAIINGSYKPHGVLLFVPVPKNSEQTTNQELDKAEEGNTTNQELDNTTNQELDNTTNQELDKAEEGVNTTNQELNNTTNQELDRAEEGVNTAKQEFNNTTNQELDEAEGRVNTTEQELGQARKALKNSCVEMEKLVVDPLPALLSRQGVVRRSLMEPHPSAQAQAWDEEHGVVDEIEESPTGSGSASRRIRLPAIRESRPSESRSPLYSPVKQRRMVKKWTQEEVDILKREVQKYGKGRWKMILLNNKDVLQDRTEVDIKDKWRNLEKYGLV